jgi:hypothetical protein
MLAIYQIPGMSGHKHDTCFFRGTTISWKSIKHTLVVMSTNHSEIIALYETSRQCV